MEDINELLQQSAFNDAELAGKIAKLILKEELNKHGLFKQVDEKLILKDRYLALTRNKQWSEATELLVNYIKENRRIFTTKDDLKSEMWIYRGGIYIPQGKSEIKEMLRDILDSWYSAFVFNQVINKLEPDTFIEIDKFFSNNDPYEIPVENGILNIKTRELKPFTPDKIFFNKLPVKYDPNEEGNLIDNFLSEVLSQEDDKKVFYEIGGSILLKEYMFEKAFIFVGNGRNGKDKSLELIKRLIGVENCCSVPLASIVPDSFIISEFFGKMANLAGEINNHDLKDTSMFKALTGRSLLSAQRKFLKPITFVNHAKFVFACNELPMVYDMSRGFWDRWVLLEFPYTFVGKDEIDKNNDNNKLKLKDECVIEKITTPKQLSGLLNKFLDGFDRLTKNKTFSSTMGSEEIKNIWIRKSNSFIAFCIDNIEAEYDSIITKKELRKKYTDYCKKHKVTPKSDYVIKRALEENFGAIDGFKTVFSGLSERVWEGIRWKC